MTILARREAGAVQTGRAIYELGTRQVTLVMKDGTTFVLEAGAGVEQWEP